MKKITLSALLFFMLGLGAQATELKVKLGGIEAGKPIPEKFAYCVAKPGDKSASGENISPAISWEKAPEGTKSFALIVVDRDVPTNFENKNKEGKVIAAQSPRQNFYHWILVNIQPAITSIPEGKGKDASFGDPLINDFMKFSGMPKNSENMKKFFGYDGPCPPWNDERMHHYHFKVYALSQTFSPGDDYTGDEIVRAITPYILAEGEVVGSYTLNPALMPKSAAQPSGKQN